MDAEILRRRRRKGDGEATMKAKVAFRASLGAGGGDASDTMRRWRRSTAVILEASGVNLLRAHASVGRGCPRGTYITNK